MSDSSAEISRLRSEVSDLRHQVGKVSGLGDRLRTVERTVESIPSALHDLARRQTALQDTLNNLVQMYERDRIVQAAHNELTVAEREWQARFGRYEDARNMAASIIDVVASGHIDRTVVLDVTERLAIQTPRYWVAQATLAVAAWLSDDQRQHREALDFALNLDYEKTTLFMALLLRDTDRDEALQEWLAAYLSRLTPVRLPRHFQVVIDAATGKAFGDGAAPRLGQQMGDWYNDEGGRQDILDATVSDWKRRLLNLGASAGDQPRFPLLTANQQAWKALAGRYEASRAIEEAARYFPGRFAAGAQVSGDIRQELAGLLADLARTEDPDEEELRGRINLNRAITLAKGDPDAARAMVVADEESRRSTLNIVGMVSQAAFPARAGGPPPSPSVTELLAIVLSQKFIVAAAEELREDLPAVGTVEITVTFGERPWVCRFECADPASRTRPALRGQAEEQATKVSAQIDRETKRRLGRLEWLKKWGCPSGLAAAAGLAGAAFIPGDPRELLIPAFVVLVPSVLGLSRLPTVVRRAADQTEAEKRAVRGQFNAAADELADVFAADLSSAEVHLPSLRRYVLGLTQESVSAATRPVPAIPLPKTREFPPWNPSPPRRHPEIETEDDPPSLRG
ncbi:MAG: hypothetical protein ABSA02_07320 [Trebonia sp.]|jgi:hypothetical protein